MHWPSIPMTTDRLTDETMYVLTDKTLQVGGQQTVDALKTWSLLQAEKYRETIAKRRCLAEAQQSQADKDQRDAAAELAALRSEEKALPRPYWARAVLFLAAATVGLVAEFALTWVTLPFLLDLKRSSLIAILLSLSPVATSILLEVVFDRLVEQPWMRVQIAGSRSLGDTDRQDSERRMDWVLLALGVLILSMFLSLGVARLEGVHWQTLLTTGESTELTPLVSFDLALVIFSIGVLVVTAWLLLIGLDHARLCARRVSLALRIRRQTRHFQQARQAAADAAAEAIRWRMKDAQSNRLTVLVAQWLFACQMIRLRDGHGSLPDLAQQVEWKLSHLSLSPGPAS